MGEVTVLTPGLPGLNAQVQGREWGTVLGPQRQTWRPVPPSSSLGFMTIGQHWKTVSLFLRDEA